jgi:hypothetical protein
MEIVKNAWATMRTELADIDLDIYQAYSQVRSFAPKSRINVRRVALLHPYDLILYTTVVLQLRECISTARLGGDRVFSYRTEGAPPDRLYLDARFWRAFRECAIKRIAQSAGTFVGIADIADFFPRIYHHRLENALLASSTPTQTDYIRVLKKLLAQFSDGVSYGIPVGPPASFLLGEAVLIDVDNTLLSYTIDFIRYVDDFVIFAPTPEGAEYALRVLGETLYLNHGLTLQTAKTRVLPVAKYFENYLALHSEKEENRRKLLQLFQADGYEVTSYEDLEDDQKKEIDAFNLSDMLQDALTAGEEVNFREVAFILGRLAALRKPELIPIVIANLERLYPVADAVAAFFKEFSGLPWAERNDIAAALLAPIITPSQTKPSEFYAIWMLDIFRHQRDWGHVDKLLRIFREASSDTVRRFAALALATSGTRTEAMAIREYLPSGSALSKTAMLLATAKLGRDERAYLRRGLRLGDSLEKLCAEAQI